MNWWTYRRLQKTDQWKTLKQSVLKRAKWRCETCNRRCNRLQVHHTHYRDITNPATCKALCQRCHAKTHGLTTQAWNDPQSYTGPTDYEELPNW